MNCARKMVRPTTVSCGCGATLKVKTGGGPLPSKCARCKELARAPSRKRAVAKRRKRRLLQRDSTGEAAVELDWAEQLADERVALGCAFENFRAQVLALARDWGLPAPAVP
ncbi:hypothetical protein JQX13_50440 [Archangium violaceum]|uniref:hypothetical protein n=1 Tax=Archangium violaceum TaxID=83451 RepID=UPI00193B7270|nr:hypothetical protein [Archangium violaceum]QRK08086.1 hypothetical protein JQX13_50440 [Archangium violaceum]